LVSGSAVSCPLLGGTATLQVADTALPDAVFDRIRARWATLEDRFDLVRPDSELSLVASGRSSLQSAGPEFRAAHADAMRWRNDTGGYFSPYRPGGLLDLDGLALAYALRDAAAELARSGLESWLIERGGVVISDALGAAGWTASIADPVDEGRFLTAVPLGGSWTAAATSRTRSDGGFVQATVLGRDVVSAQALATAVVTGGAAAFELATRRWPVDVLAVDGSGGLRSTLRLERHLRSSTEGSVPAGADRPAGIGGSVAGATPAGTGRSGPEATERQRADGGVPRIPGFVPEP
jgi:thiamine biosynthesis lipoprotein